MNEERRAAALHTMTAMMSALFDNVDRILDADDDPSKRLAAAASAVMLGMHPRAGALVGPLTGVLAEAAAAQAKATGKTTADVIAGWRARVGAGLNSADAILAQMEGERP